MGIQRYRDVEMQRCQNEGMQGYRDVEIQGCVRYGGLYEDVRENGNDENSVEKSMLWTTADQKLLDM